MKMKRHFQAIGFALLAIVLPLKAMAVSDLAQETAQYAADHYAEAQVQTLADLVSFKTVALPGVVMEANSQFSTFKAYVIELAENFGLRTQDHGAVVIVSLGEQAQRVGIVTHGDVQPADPSKWAKDPFVLDRESEPGKLLGRGTEDDKGPIATALYAMKTIQEREIPLTRGIDLIIYLAEESDWQPLIDFIAEHPVPEFNVTIDASYPVVVAEKGYSLIEVTVPAIQTPEARDREPQLVAFHGGAFKSQIPENAFATITGAGPELVDTLQQRSTQHSDMSYEFDLQDTKLKITASGTSAHSSTPQHGVNGIAFLADLLATHPWPNTRASATVAYISELAGTGYLGEDFGDLAYQHDFMGPMTLAPTLVEERPEGTRITINIRRPFGKTAEQLVSETNTALEGWQQRRGVALDDIALSFGDPIYVKDAPHVEKLLDVFSHFTGIEDPQPLAIGGSTNAKLLPNAVSFGPAMPGVKYTGHSEHEYITREQFTLNLRMYTAMMVEMGQFD